MKTRFYTSLVMTYCFALLLLARPAFAQEYATSQTNGVMGVCLGCGVVNADNAVDQSDLTDYSVFYIIAGVLNTTVQQTLIFPQSSNNGDSLFIRIGCTNAILSANLLGCVNIETYNGNTANADGQFVTQPILRILDGGTSAMIALKPPHSFDRVKISLHSSLLGLLTGFRVYYAFQKGDSLLSAPDVIPDTVTLCQGDTATFHVDTTAATIRWYDDATSGNLLATGNIFSVHPDTTTVYYAEAEAGGIRSQRTPATVVVHPTILPLRIRVPASVEAGTSATYTIENPQEGITYRWYRALSGQPEVATGTSYKTEPLADTLQEITVWVEAINLVTGCRRPLVKITTKVTGGSAPNLALNKPALASSEELGMAANAVDGNYDSYWRSAQSFGQFIRVDLGADYDIQRVKITWKEGLAEIYDIQVSDDGTGNWQTLKSVSGNAAPVTDDSGLSGHGRYLLISSPGGGLRIYELEVYGALHAGAASTGSQWNVSPFVSQSLKPSSEWITRLSPNPTTNGQLQLQSNEGIKQIRLIDMNGRTWMQRSLHEMKGGGTSRIDVSRLPAGIYMVQLSSTSNATRVLKFIKQ